MTITKGEKMSSKRTRLGTLALVLTCAVAGALLIAGPASAASRGFKIHNNSSHALHLEAVKRVPTYVCANPGLCVPTHYKMDFEGRPADGTVLHPGHENVFELKYGFSLLGGVQYAANIWYKIAGNGGTVEYTIEVYSTANESACKVTPAHAGRCTAEGTKLTFHNG
jgi:hypothetical protein